MNIVALMLSKCGMNAHMAIEIAGLTETKETQLALVWLLAGVNAQVFRECRRVGEGLLAHATPIGTFTRVGAHVSRD